uniref:Uncharacterized protein n=1 Tax=Arundo donax TaxID=35708 RepID=A0A0A9C9A4_ARUDO
MSTGGQRWWIRW